MTDPDRRAAIDLLLGLLHTTDAISVRADRGDDEALAERAILAAALAKELAKLFGIKRPAQRDVTAARLAARDLISRARQQ